MPGPDARADDHPIVGAVQSAFGVTNGIAERPADERAVAGAELVAIAGAVVSSVADADGGAVADAVLHVPADARAELVDPDAGSVGVSDARSELVDAVVRAVVGTDARDVAAVLRADGRTLRGPLRGAGELARQEDAALVEAAHGDERAAAAAPRAGALLRAGDLGQEDAQRVARREEYGDGERVADGECIGAALEVERRVARAHFGLPIARLRG